MSDCKVIESFSNISKSFLGITIKVYKCTIRDFYFPSSNKYIHSGHLAGYGDSDVQELTISGSKFEDFRNFDTIFNYDWRFVHLSITNCGLRNCDFESLIWKCPSLITLNLDKNNFTTIPELISKLPKLKNLSLVGNVITKISEETFRHLKNSCLKLIDLRENRSYDICFDAQYEDTLEQFLNEVRNFKVPTPNVTKCLQTANQFLWDSSEMSDFIISTKAKDFRVHKNILAASSSVFRGMFSHEMTENLNNKMAMEDFETEVVEQFLIFIYLARVPKDDTHLVDLFAIAAKYDVNQLKDYCEIKISKNLNDVNIGCVLSVANLYNSTLLKEKAFKRLQKMFGDYKIDEKLMQKPEKIRGIIEARQKIADILKDENEEEED